LFVRISIFFKNFSEDDFIIPTLPQGRELVINIKTTWGDKHYVGLTGLQLFSHTGHPITITQVIYAKFKGCITHNNVLHQRTLLP